MNYKKEAGRRLRAARLAKELTLEDLSAKVGKLLSPSRLSNYEQGIRMIGVQEALALYPHLGVEPSHLLCVDVEEGDLTPQENRLLRNFRSLPEKDRNEYERRIELLSMVYREAVPDEKLSAEVRRGASKKTVK